MCPVCTVGVVAGLGIAEKYGINDIITGIWFGGLIISLTGWTINWLRGKKWNFRGYKIVSLLVYVASVILPLYFTDKIGSPFHTYWGIDKLILGILLGSIGFLIGAITYMYFKKKNDKALFPFSKVVLPIAPLIILTIIFYYITK